MHYASARRAGCQHTIANPISYVGAGANTGQLAETLHRDVIVPARERGYRRIRDVKARHFRVLRSVDRQHARELVGNREHVRIARRLKDGK